MQRWQRWFWLQRWLHAKLDLKDACPSEPRISGIFDLHVGKQTFSVHCSAVWSMHSPSRLSVSDEFFPQILHIPRWLDYLGFIQRTLPIKYPEDSSSFGIGRIFDKCGEIGTRPFPTNAMVRGSMRLQKLECQTSSRQGYQNSKSCRKLACLQKIVKERLGNFF